MSLCVDRQGDARMALRLEGRDAKLTRHHVLA